MITAQTRTTSPSSLVSPDHLLIRLITCLSAIYAFSGCVQETSPYRLLSDEVIGMIASPPYSAAQVKQAQITLRERSAARLRETVIQSQLKSFACMMVSQQLDPMSARGENAPSELPCSFDSSKRCAHRCKRSRLPPKIKLPREYTDVARRYDEIIWQDLNRVAESGVEPQWENYLTQCLECDHSKAIKRRVCLRDVDGVELTAERRDHSPLDRWLNQCSVLRDPEIKALVSYRKAMLTPPEDLAYPLVIPKLPKNLQAGLTARAVIGQGKRLLAGSLDEEKISALLSAEESKAVGSDRWLSIQEQLRRRLDAPLMPCLEHGLDTCIVEGQITLAREQSRDYLERCTLCEHRAEIESWRQGLSLGLEPTWRSQDQRDVQVALRHQAPSSLLISENQALSRFTLEEGSDRLLWSTPLRPDGLEISELHFWPPREGEVTPPTQGKAPFLLASNERALYAIDPQSGALRWTYRSPFDQSGTLIPCLRVDPLASGLFDGPLKRGGAICYKRSAIHLLSIEGEEVVKLLCHDPRGCGDRVSLTRVTSPTELGPPRQQTILIMSHPLPDPSPSNRQRTLSVYRFDDNRSEGELPIEFPPSHLEALSGPWDSLLVTQAHPIEAQHVHLIGVRKVRRKLSISAIRLADEALIWQKQVKGRSLVHQPSLRLDPSQNRTLVGVLTDRSFNALKLSNGALVVNESLPLKRSPSEQRLIASQSPLSWELIGGRLIVLHPLNRALYFSDLTQGNQKNTLRNSSLLFQRLDARASLTSIDAQWVVISPQEGEVIGVHPLLDQVVWRWRSDPFDQISLSRSWALLTRGQQSALYRVRAKSLGELAESPQSQEALSRCSQGDRWDCLHQGDLLIGIPKMLSDQDRHQAIATWYNTTRQARSFKEAKLSKVDALMAQDAWAVACHWGIGEACTRLGALAEFGFFSRSVGALPTGVPALKKAADFYARGAQLGDPLGAERNGVLLEQGQGVPRNYPAARHNYLSACDAGYPHACARWGFLNELGLGGATKLVTAVAAYQKACEAGSRWACDRLESERLRELY